MIPSELPTKLTYIGAVCTPQVYLVSFFLYMDLPHHVHLLQILANSGFGGFEDESNPIIPNLVGITNLQMVWIPHFILRAFALRRSRM